MHFASSRPVPRALRLRAALGGALVGALLLGHVTAQAETTSEAGPTPFGLTCAAQDDGTRFCEGSMATRIPSFDGVPLDVNVALPAAASTDLPLVVLSHGYSGEKTPFPGMRSWARAGYAVLAITARGFGHSCGSPESRLADPDGCATGTVRLDDTRYEVRDIQTLAGLLADQGIVDGQRIGLVGGSYGGGVSMAGAVLKDRIMDTDGALKPWRSPLGKPMAVAGAAPSATWSDLLYALAPNGRVLDYVVSDTGDSTEPYGITKTGVAALLGASGARSGYYGAEISRLVAGLAVSGDQPRNPAHDGFVQEMTRFHSSLSLLEATGAAPAPLLMTSGFTDDLFPVDESLRLYNKVRALWPQTPISLRFSDTGHFRAQKKTTDDVAQNAAIRSWMDFYVKGAGGSAPYEGVSAYTQTCPKEAPAGGPFFADSWAQMRVGEIRSSFPAEQTVSSAGGDPQVALDLTPAFIPLTPVNTKACDQTDDLTEAGTAEYRIPITDAATFIGSPTVIADLQVIGAHGQLATRLLDVDTATGKQTLIARGLYRPEASGRQVFQLHPGAWTFQPGHEAKLQLLGKDVPYGAADRAPFSIAVSNLELRLPVIDAPNGASIREPAPYVLPPGAVLAPGAAPKAQGELRLSLPTTTPVSGAGFTVTVTALDAAGSTDSSWRGTPALTSTDTHSSLPNCGAAVEGVATCSGVVLGDLGAQDVTAQAAGYRSGAASATVQPTGLVFTTAPERTQRRTDTVYVTTPTVGVPGALTDGYRGTQAVSTDHDADRVPGPQSCAGGSCSFTMQFDKAGKHTVTVRDDAGRQTAPAQTHVTG